MLTFVIDGTTAHRVITLCDCKVHSKISRPLHA